MYERFWREHAQCDAIVAWAAAAPSTPPRPHGRHRERRFDELRRCSRAARLHAARA
jgi:hypothetical protein